MAHMLDFQLTNSEGIGRAVYCHGLDVPVLIAPKIYTEPLLTSQAFYYLEDLESIARLQVDSLETKDGMSDERSLERYSEYLVDNYLFAFSIKHPAYRLTTKVTRPKYWRNEGGLYRGYDGNNTGALALDILNDRSIKSIKSSDRSDRMDWADWCLAYNYTHGHLQEYVKSMKSVVETSVFVETDDHDLLGTGTVLLPLVRPNDGLLDYNQACRLEALDPRYVDIMKNHILVSSGIPDKGDYALSLEVVVTNRLRDPELLAYYFAGLREHTPIAQFRSFYNVLEYFFEHAPLALGRQARFEREQLACVIEWITAVWGIREFFNGLDDECLESLGTELVAANSQKIEPVDCRSDDSAVDLANRIYSVRCACVHSKATKRGKPTARFMPYSEDEKLIAHVVTVLQKLAVACIEKDSSEDTSATPTSRADAQTF